MSIADFDKVDGMGILKDDEKTLVLIITDHLFWDDEEAHIWALEDKINVYVNYIESQQFKKKYPESNFERFIIQIYFLHQYPSSCVEFLALAEHQLAPLNITFRTSVESL